MSNWKRMKIMKKLLYSALALVGILAVSCNKETEAPQTAPERSGKTHTVTLKAAFAEEGETRTAYTNNKTFSWVAGDVVYVRCMNEEYYWYWAPFTADNSGAETTLTGEVDEGYEPYDVAVYVPGEDYVETEYYNGSSVRVVAPISYHENGYGLDVDSDGDTTPYWNSVSIDSANPLSRLPLVSVTKNDVFYFQTAMGALKVNMTGVSAEATHVRITTADGCIGNYLMVQDGEIRMSEPWYDEDGQRFATSFAEYYFQPVSDGNVSFVMPLAVGTLPVGSTFSILDENDNVLYTKTVRKDITIARNKVTELVAFNAQSDWKSVGMGKFYDSYVWEEAGWTAGEYVDVEIFQDASNPGIFRIASPYGAAATHFNYTPAGTVVPADEYLTLTITEDYVSYPDHNTGVYDAYYGEGTLLIHPLYYFGIGRNIVAKYGAKGLPANILLAPIYYWPDAGYWTEDTFVNDNDVIQILFPGASSLDLNAVVSFVEISNDDPAAAIALADVVLGSDIVSAKLVVAADAKDAVAALSDPDLVTSVSATGEYEVKLPANAPSGDYYVYLQTTPAEGLTEVAVQLASSEKFYFTNKDEDLGLDVSVLYGTWSGGIYWKYGSWYDTTINFTFAETDDPFSGDVLVTEIWGEEAVFPVYAWFDGKTGVLTMPGAQPWYLQAVNGTTYAVGLVDANNPEADLVFRYRSDGTLYMDPMFAAFYLYDADTFEEDPDLWLGYFYGKSDDDHLVLTKETASSAPARVKAHRDFTSSMASKVKPVRKATK